MIIGSPLANRVFRTGRLSSLRAADLSQIPLSKTVASTVMIQLKESTENHRLLTRSSTGSNHTGGSRRILNVSLSWTLSCPLGLPALDRSSDQVKLLRSSSPPSALDLTSLARLELVMLVSSLADMLMLFDRLPESGGREEWSSPSKMWAASLRSSFKVASDFTDWTS
eukprot:768628-Hanusia_phi.AAC.3